MKFYYAIPLALALAGSFAAQQLTPAKDAAPIGKIVRLDPAFDALVPKDAKIEKVGGGFTFTEGPMWRSSEGVLWFSDVPGNLTRSISPTGEVKVLIQNSGGTPVNPRRGAFVGPNGMVPDKDGAVLVCQHTNRAIARIAKDLTMTPYIEKFEGHRLNSPNDLVYRSDGSLYFTDPPYGLGRGDTDPAKEIPFNGVFQYKNGVLKAVIKDLSRPNGIGFSPDEKTMYVANSDDAKRSWMRYDVAADGSVSNGRLFFDLSTATEKGIPDGLKIDSKGNLWGAGPEGVWVISPEGKHIGTIQPGETAANLNWGDDGKSLYITASTSVYRIKLSVAGQTAPYQSYKK